jgi:hypothetical protein
MDFKTDYSHNQRVHRLDIDKVETIEDIKLILKAMNIHCSWDLITTYELEKFL